MTAKREPIKLEALPTLGDFEGVFIVALALHHHTHQAVTAATTEGH